MPPKPKKDQKKAIKRPKRTLICWDCDKEFESSAPNAKYCWHCRLLRFHPKNRAETIICENCGKEKKTTYSWSRFCCTACRNAWHRKDMTRKLKQLKKKEEI